MQQIAQADLPTAPGTPLGGGFYSGKIRIENDIFAIVVAPKDGGEHKRTKWNGSSRRMIVGAQSFNDGRANTIAMAEAGSSLAKWALELSLNGQNDWHLPAQDELEIVHRHLKPSTGANFLWNRSGINLSAVPPTYPYTEESPIQTLATAFQSGGTEAFETDWYWTSTQVAGDADYAWVQYFTNGYQVTRRKSSEYRARAVRRILVIQ